MLILAFDTTGERGGAGIFRDEQCLAITENTERANYSVLLFELVERTLAQTRLTLSAMDLIAVANGPGSFTGIRVGVAAAQGWATALGRPVSGVSNLAAMATLAPPGGEHVAAILDAHRGEFYAALFRRASALPGNVSSAFEPVSEGWVLKPELLAQSLAGRIPAGAALTCVTREHDLAAQEARAYFPGNVQWHKVSGTLVPAIARIALEAHARGRLQSPDELDACYIRRTDAEMKWQE